MYKFIVFEGLDGSGKDTQLDKAISYIRQKNKYSQLWITREPTHNTKAGKEIAKKLAGKGFKDGYEALNLYVQDRIEQTKIRKEILKHSHILSSRFDYSTYAYQVAQGLSFKEIYNAHDYDKILLPDITFIFDVSIDNIKNRLKSRGEKKEFFEELNFLTKVREKYLDSYKKLKKERKLYLINANGSIENTFEYVKKILDKELFSNKIN